MTSKTGTKKKKGTKSAVSQFLRSTDDEIKAELEAMTNLEYNLHSDFETPDRPPDTALFSVRKTRAVNPKDTSKYNKQLAPAADKPSTKSERFDTENQIQTYVTNASVEELQAVVRQAAATSEDKYRILDARDRLMRNKQAKSQTLSMTTVTRGTCPDMCPEKERLMRESQRQVASYELLEGPDYRINHETAVKQYSRSSADQEEPMPQDLRPVDSLKMTMSYLLHEIADLSEQNGTNLAEWYHFMWDRTRGVRKDITQQELCCNESVALVEQCARFHIFCAERLCAEEVSVFDKKINTENLTKCLQTLKYMYNDLRLKGIACKNEPEFRAYIILLNLNNGNFMWDVQRLPTFVQKSSEVRFAVEIYSSIESNNYAKFFRLVRSTTYPNACILLRYFNQVRVKALSIMVKAYSKTTAFPLYELIDILGFEDENDAVYFCEQVGLNLSSDDLHIMLNRQNFSLPMSNIEQGRACNTVETKRTAGRHSIGQCIAGGTMPEKSYVGHKPHDSFDSQGYLKSESLNAADQNPGTVDKPSDPYEYMEDDIFEPPQTLRPQPETKKPLSTSAPYESPVSVEEKRSNNSHIFKMPTSTNHQSNVFQSAPSPFAKKISTQASSKKAEESSPFPSDSMVANLRKRDADSARVFGLMDDEGAKPRAFDRPTAQLKRSRDEDDSPFSQATPSIFGNSGRSANVFAKPTMKAAKTFGERLGGEAKSGGAMSTSTSIFGKPIAGNVFNNVGSTPSIFAASSNGRKVSSPPSTESWSGGKASIFQSSQPSIEATRARERQEEAKKQESERRRLLEQEREKMLRRTDRETESILDELENEIIHDVCSTIVKEEMERMRLYATLSDKIVGEILDECVGEDCEEILNGEIYVQRKIEELSRRTRNRIILKYYKIWRQYSSRKRQQRSALDVTPVWLQKRSVEECAKSLYRRDQDVAIRNMRQKRSKPSGDESQLEFLQPIESKIYAGIKENAKALDIDAPPNLFWKMVISWPHLDTRPVLWRLKRIMNEYICPSDSTMETVVKSYKPNSYETLHICVKHFEGLTSDRNLTGSDGLFFVATSSENPKYIVRRLTSTVLARQKLMPIPVIVVIIGEGSVDPRNIRLDDELNALSESGYVSEYTIHYEETVDEKVILKLIQTATLWLTINKSPPVPLEMDYLSKIVDTCLAEELWHRILGHASFNKLLGAALEDVRFVIDLHNEAVTHLIDIVLDPEALMYTDFPPEFKMFVKREFNLPCSYEYFDGSWKRNDRREKMERIMNDLLLPKWTFDWPIDDTMELHRCVVRYCQRTLKDSNYNTVSCNILSNVLLMPRAACKTSFIQVLLEILKEKIRHLKPDVRLVYNKNHIKHFRTLPWWFKSVTLTSYNEDTSHSRTADAAAADESMITEESFDVRESDADIDELVREYFVKCYESIDEEADASESFGKEAHKQSSEFSKLSETFERTLAEQKSRSRILEEKLAAAIRENDGIGAP